MCCGFITCKSKIYDNSVQARRGEMEVKTKSIKFGKKSFIVDIIYMKNSKQSTDKLRINKGV